MTSTRSAASRRKRDSTTNAVDLLNSVMDTSGLLKDSPRTQSTRQSKTKKSEKVPPNDDFGELPRSTAKRRRFARQSLPFLSAQSLTPRRSQRLQKDDVQVETTPTRRSRRLMREGSVELSGLEESRPASHASDRNREENIGGDPESSHNDIQEDEIVGVNFFSDDISISDTELVLPPASIVLGQKPWEPLDSQESDQSGAGSESETFPYKGVKGSTSKNAASQAGAIPNSSPSPVAPETSLMVYIDRAPSIGHENAKAAAVARMTNMELGSEEENSQDSDEVMDPEENNGIEEKDKEGDDSVYETVAETPPPRFSPLFISQDSSPASAPRRNWRSVQMKTHKGQKPLSSPSASFSSASDTSKDNRVRPLRQQSSRNNHFSYPRFVDDSDHEMEERDTSSLLGEVFRGDWKTLSTEAHILREVTNPLLASEFEDIMRLIAHLRRLYINVRDGLEAYRAPAVQKVLSCENWVNSIPRQGDELLDRIYYMAIHRKESNKRRSQRLLAEFEARVIPEMVGLIETCFEAYHTDPERFPEAYDHVHRLMVILLRFCERMRGLTAAKYVPGSTRTLKIRKALKELIESSRSQQLGKQKPKLLNRASTNFRNEDDHDSDDDDSFYPDGGKPWTEEEGCCLLNGLQHYQDRDRYIWILRDFHKVLGDRTIRDLRLQAQNAYDRLIPTLQEELCSREGRQRWRWLLSVRE